jgi:hypothetical protein
MSLALAGKRRMRSRADLLLMCMAALAVPLVPVASMAEENLPAKRQLCQSEARERIKPRGRADGSLYPALIRKRHGYVQECMARAPGEPKSKATGSITTKAPAQPAGAKTHKPQRSRH